MAPYTYYYSFSIILTTGLLFYILNLIYLRTRGKTFVGLKFRRGSAEYRRVVTLASNRNLVIASTLNLFLAANLANSIRLILRLHNPHDARSVLLIIPLFIAVIGIVGYFKTHPIDEMFNKKS